MNFTSRLSTGHRRFFSLALLGCACAISPLCSLHAQGTLESAPVASNGINSIETSGVYPTNTNGSNRYLDVGAGYKFPSFAVLDFSTSSYALGYPVTGVNTLSLALTEADTSTTRAGSFTVYLSEDTASIATANGGSPLTYQSANAPGGLGTQLGDSTTLFSLGTFTSSASTTGTTKDTYSLSLSSTAQSYFLNQLNNSTADLRLVIVSNDTAGYGTFNGNTSAVASVSQPTLAFNAVLNRPTLAFTPSGANGGSGTWLPAGTAGDTSWNNGPWISTSIAQYGGTGGNVTIGTGGVTAAGIQFDVTGYTVGTATGPSITLAANSSGVAPTIQVTNATDTATVNAPVAGASGLTKAGAGTLVLGGTNTYTGGTTINAGTLQVSTDANLGDASNAVTLNGGTLHPVGSPTLARAIGGSGGILVDSGSTVNISGVVNASSLTLPGAGTLALTNSSFAISGGASNAVTGTITFATAGATLTASSTGATPSDGQGVMNVGSISATQSSGAVTLAATLNIAGTSTVNVANSGASLNLPGSMAGAGTIAKTGAGTLVLGGDNSGLTGTASFRQGTAGATPVSGGIVSIAATNPNPGAALGAGLYDANGGTVSNDTGKPVALAITGISVGAQDTVGTPGGLVFAGTGANPSITVTGAISLYKGGATTYQHTITVNTPTTFTGLLTASANTTTSLGLTLAGSSTLTLAGTARNTLFEPITIATTGANGGVVAAADGTFAANTSVTINAGAKLTLNTGATSGTVDTINDAAMLVFASQSGAFGKIALNIGTGQETVGGLMLAANDGTLASGYLPAGTYGATGSGAMHIDNTLFSGTGVILNLATAVPEPSTWTAAIAGLGLLSLGWMRRARRA